MTKSITLELTEEAITNINCCNDSSNIIARRTGDFKQPNIEIYCKICGTIKNK